MDILDKLKTFVDNDIHLEAFSKAAVIKIHNHPFFAARNDSAKNAAVMSEINEAYQESLYPVFGGATQLAISALASIALASVRIEFASLLSEAAKPVLVVKPTPIDAFVIPDSASGLGESSATPPSRPAVPSQSAETQSRERLKPAQESAKK